MDTKNQQNNFSHPAVIITVLILIFIGGYFLLNKNQNSKQSEIDALKTEVENLKNSNKPVPVENHLTASLTPFKFSQNINALITQGADTKVIQEYVNNYQKDSLGNFVLKSSQ
jgi:hypothetical protein